MDAQPANLLITCPTTGEKTSTGWFIDAAALDLLDLGVQQVHCERCHETHPWGRSDVAWETF